MQQGNGAPQITMQPASQTVTAGQSATFTVAATGSPTLAYQWQKNHEASRARASAVVHDSGDGYFQQRRDIRRHRQQFRRHGDQRFRVADVEHSAGGTPPPPRAALPTDVTTYHYDNLRTGAKYTREHSHAREREFVDIWTARRFSGRWARRRAAAVSLERRDSRSQGTKNVLYVVTEHDSVYAFDADSVNATSATTLWRSSMLAAGETSSDDRSCGQVTPEIGITSTPVIDRTRNAIYVVAVSKTSSGAYVHRVHALNLTTGAELFGGPTTITATYPGSGANSSNGNVVFDPSQYNERPGLLEVGGTIFTTWGSHCDAGPYTSWVMAYNADTLHQTGVINMVPNGNEGGIWMAGAGPGADASGNIYFIIGNGDFGTTLDSNGFPVNKNCGNCFAKISSTMPLALRTTSLRRIPSRSPTPIRILAPEGRCCCQTLLIRTDRLAIWRLARARTKLFTSSIATTWGNSIRARTISISRSTEHCRGACGRSRATSTVSFITALSGIPSRRFRSQAESLRRPHRRRARTRSGIPARLR